MLESTAQWSSLSKEYAYSVKPVVEQALLAIVDEHTAGFNGLRQLMRCVRGDHERLTHSDNACKRRAITSSEKRSRIFETSTEVATGRIQVRLTSPCVFSDLHRERSLLF